MPPVTKRTVLRSCGTAFSGLELMIREDTADVFADDSEDSAKQGTKVIQHLAREEACNPKAGR